MLKKPSSSTVNQAVVGNDNIQVVGSNNAITQITKFFTADSEARRAMRNRRSMLELVKNTWIKGVLEKSLHNEVLMQLGMEERPGAVEHPWDVQIHIPNKENRTLPAETSMLQVFNDMNGAMLILGEPGSGKTTMLLELARECIACAELDENLSIPVVFNLSSWNVRQTMEVWLESELNTKYNVPKKIARTWLKNDDLLLLLDGLDEVKREYREAGIRAINNFRHEHGLAVSIAVCSRIADYEALTTKLSLSGAVILQPLTTAQINEYLDRAGVELDGMRQALESDQALQELVKQPLTLSIMTLAYRGKSNEIFEIGGLESIDAQRKHLFDTYIQRMFNRPVRTKKEQYTVEETNQWLSWLAKSMVGRGHTIFFLDQIYLLLSPRTEVFLRRLIALIILGVFVSGHLIGALFGGIVPEIFLPVGLLIVIESSLLVLTILIIYIFKSKHGWGIDEEVNAHTDFLAFSWRTSLPGIICGLILGAVVFIIQPLFLSFIVFALVDSFALGLIYGLVLKGSGKSREDEDKKSVKQSALKDFISKRAGVVFGPVLEEFYGEKEWTDNLLSRPTEMLRWSWRRALHGIVVGMSVGFITGLLTGIITGLIYAFPLQNNPDFGFRLGFIMGFTYGPFAGAFLMLFLGIIGFVIYGLNKESLENKSYPNQGIRQSIKSAGITTIFTGFAFAVLGLVISPLIYSQVQLTSGETNTVLAMGFVLVGAGSGFIVGVLFGGIFSLYYGGYAAMYHYCVRLILSHSEYLPWKLIPFLDYCVDRIFLRRVGSGYIFIHRLLMEHFAGMYPDNEK